ncbi:1-acyl-sn-glycerol-3-phosphate acyltransferase [Massilia sp. LC238]|uniref:lysophospholipid acyltransferase family protein n=1 Tax=Massilia sp. LC238 TaxID=1502852 RepID=UPI0004E2D74E|nr:lysophospholipid acyltransferase family protein [Massilia sp. LC238]KFC64262.1 1-acylglycerol-3-phosphate O-acyltransferase [Massilia sp. LC238]
MKIRLALRLARVVVHLVAGLATCALVFPLVSLATRERLTRRWSRKLLGLCRVSVEQAPGAPVLEHALIVANHVSWLDIFVINALHPCRFVAKAEIRSWPVLGWLAAAAGTVFIARGNRRELRHIFKGLVTVLQEGQRVAFFPEGTTSRQGEVLPFHANLFEAAIDAKVAVQPYALSYVDASGAYHHSVDYTGDTTFVDSLFTILEGKPVIARLQPLAPIDATGAHRRELAEAAQEAVGAALLCDM